MRNLANITSLTQLGQGGRLSALARARTFYAPLTDSLFASGKGSTTPTFTRATTAYVNDYENIPRLALAGEARFQGALRVHNQFLTSQDFSSINWTRNAVTGSTFTGLADPFGGTSAMKLVGDNGVAIDGNNGFASIAQAVTKLSSTADVVSVSVYAKAGESYVLKFREQTTSGYRAVFNLVTGEITYENSATRDNFAAQMTAVGNGWYRCQVRYTTSSGATQNFCFKASGAGTSATCDGVSGLYLAFAQYEDVSGSAVLAMSPYVSTNVLSAPYHGANVDGVKYFSAEEIHQQNYVRQSEDLTNATFWSNSGTAPTTVASVGAVGPFGGNATRIVFASGSVSLRTNGVPTLYGRYYKIGAWVKSNTGANQSFRLNIFDAVASFYSDDMVATTEWQYFTYGPKQAMGALGFLCRIANDTTFQASDILVGGMTCFEDSPYISTEYVSNADDRAGLPIPTGQFVNIPSTTLHGYLTEGQRTNLVRWTEDYSNAAWTLTDTTVTTNSVPSPNGRSTADRLLSGTAGTAVVVQGGIPIAVNTLHTASVYVRPGNPATCPWFLLRYMNNAGTDGGRAWFNMATGELGAVSVVGAGTSVQAEITTEKNGFYRCSVSAIVDGASVSGQVQMFAVTADNVTTRFNDAIYYLWGAQLEVEGEASSYFPTTSGSLVRSPDYLLYANTGNVNDAKATVYGEFKRNSTNVIGDRRCLGLSGTTNNRFQMLMGQTVTPGASLLFGTGAGVGGTTPISTGYGKNIIKFAGTWDNAVFGSPTHKITGAVIGENTFSTPAVISTGIAVGGIIGNAIQHFGTARNIRIYKVLLTDAQLAAITA